MGITLRCTAGPSAGESITVEVELVLGRDQSEPGRLGGDPRLSRRHARVFVDDAGRPTVEDLGSTNGTWVNGARLTGARILATGDELTAGQTTFEVDCHTEPAATRQDTRGAVATPTLASAPAPSPALLVRAGPKEGEQIQLGDELLIGRSYNEPGALGGDRLLSRRHARLARGPGGVFFVEDTGSTNGTMLNGVALRGAHALKDGDEIKLGASTLEAHGFPSAAFAAQLEEEPAAAPRFDPWEAGHAAGRVAVPPAAAAPAQAFPIASQFMPQGAAGSRLSHRPRRVIGLFAAVFVAAAIVAGAFVLLAAPLGSRSCPSGFVCHKPPTAAPLEDLTTFAGALGWRVEFDSQMATPASMNAKTNQIVLTESSAYDRSLGQTPGSQVIGVLVRAFPSRQTSPTAAIQTLASTIGSHLVGPATARSSDQLFGQPVVGFHPGQGEVLEGSARTPQGPGGLEKLAVVSAASGGVTVAVGVLFPVQPGQSQGENPDKPYDQFGDQILETVRFPGDGAT